MVAEVSQRAVEMLLLRGLANFFIGRVHLGPIARYCIADTEHEADQWARQVLKAARS